MRAPLVPLPLLLVVWLGLSATAPRAAPPDPQQQPGLVRVGGRTAFVIEEPVGAISPQERAAIVNERVQRILGASELDPQRMEVRRLGDGAPTVALGDLLIVSVTPADAAANGTTPERLADRWAARLRTEITQLKPLYQQQGQANVKTLSEHRVLLLILQIALLLLVSRACGELLARLGQPPVLGQLLAGILLGQSIAGSLFPDVHALVFPIEATQSYLLEVVSWLGVIFLLMLTGMETDLRLILQQGRPALWTSVGGVAAPFALGFGTAYLLPESLLILPEQRLLLAAFPGTALSVSSVPVIAKILMDMRLLRRNVGQVTLAAALAHDTVGWIILAAIAGLASSGGFNAAVILRAVLGTLAFSAFSLTLGRRWAFQFL